MTSNLGSDLILRGESIAAVRDQIMELLHRTFKPEFLNRIDETLLFERLDRDAIRNIVGIQLSRLEKRLIRRGVNVKFTDALVGYIAEVGYDPAYGARPVKRAIQTYIENPLARFMLEGEYTALTIDYNGEQVVISG
jgi:ATP-dependent Clp protease ATP-binding subunit ClpB